VYVAGEREDSTRWRWHAPPDVIVASKRMRVVDYPFIRRPT